MIWDGVDNFVDGETEEPAAGRLGMFRREHGIVISVAEDLARPPILDQAQAGGCLGALDNCGDRRMLDIGVEAAGRLKPADRFLILGVLDDVTIAGGGLDSEDHGPGVSAFAEAADDGVPPLCEQLLQRELRRIRPINGHARILAGARRGFHPGFLPWPNGCRLGKRLL